MTYDPARTGQRLPVIIFGGATSDEELENNDVRLSADECMCVCLCDCVTVCVCVCLSVSLFPVGLCSYCVAVVVVVLFINSWL